MAGNNLFGETSAPSKIDIYRHCRVGRHQLRRLTADGSRRACTVCSVEYDAAGKLLVRAVYERKTIENG